VFDKYLNCTLDPYQVTGASLAYREKYFFIGDDMGLGKTVQALAVIARDGGRTLFVTPPHLRTNWEQEILLHMKNVPSYHIVKKKQDINKYNGEHFLIISNQMIEKIDPKVLKTFDNCVVDEAHAFKNPDSQRTEAFAQYVEQCRPNRLLMLSGTAIKNRVTEFFSLLYILSMNKNACAWNRKYSVRRDFPSKWDFNKKFSHEVQIKIRRRMITKYEGLKNLKLLKKYMKHRYIRRDETQQNLPDLIEMNHFIDGYKDDPSLQTIWEALLQGRQNDILAKVRSASVKAKATIEYVKGISENGSQIVVFTDHKESAETIADGLKVPFIHSGTSMKARDQIKKDFIAGNIQYFVATIGTMSEGVTLINANDVVFNDLSWVPASNRQAKKRIHRRGQTKTCRVHYVWGSYQDNQIGKLLRSKESVLREVL
jgi:SNF2 family DNA or RNA helicase